MSNEEMRAPCRESPAKFSILWSVDPPTLTYAHEHWVLTERKRSGLQAADVFNIDSAWVQPQREGKELRHPSESLHSVSLGGVFSIFRLPGPVVAL